MGRQDVESANQNADVSLGDTNMSSISIALTTFNGAPYLAAQLSSFTRQTLLPDELVVCDDGSVDGTLDVLDGFRMNSPFPMRIYQNSINLGYAQNFAKALSLCTGDLIFLSDQDDVWFDNKIETIYEMSKSYPSADLFMCNAELTDENLIPSGLTKLDQIIGAGEKEESFVMGCCMALRSSFKSWVLPIPSDISSYDGWIVELALCANRRELFRKPLQYYRRHRQNSSVHPVTNQLTKIRLFRHYGSKIAVNMRLDLGPGLATYLKFNKALRDRTRDLSNVADVKLCDCNQLSKCADHFEKKMNAIAERIRLLQKPRAARLVMLIIMLTGGSYKYFYGWRSALFDLIRR